MNNYKGAICDYYETACNLRKKLVDEIKDFVKTHGEKKEDKIVLTIDGCIDEYVPMSSVLMCTDRRNDSSSWEAVTSIIYYDDNHPLLFDSEYGSTDSDYILIGDLIDLYDTILDIEDEIKDGNIIITDGVVEAK